METGGRHFRAPFHLCIPRAGQPPARGGNPVYVIFFVPNEKNVVKSGGKWRNLYNFDALISFYIKVQVKFLGTIEAKVDAKGRVFLPSAFRKAVQQLGDDRLVLRKDVFQPCLTLYPESVWNGQVDALRRRLNRWNAAHQMLLRQFVADVELLALDASGRLLLPRRYLRMAAIDQAIQFIGMDDTIEIWPGSRGDKPFMSPDAFSQALQEVMAQPACAPYAAPVPRGARDTDNDIQP